MITYSFIGSLSSKGPTFSKNSYMSVKEVGNKNVTVCNKELFTGQINNYISNIQINVNIGRYKMFRIIISVKFSNQLFCKLL
jgi:hypothetical protein